MFKSALNVLRICAVVGILWSAQVSADAEVQLVARPAELSFNAPEAVVTRVEKITVAPASWGEPINVAINYQSGEPGWLAVVKTDALSYAVNVSATKLSAGRFTATIAFSSSAAARPVVVPVTLTIGLGILAPVVQ
mgnify:CR=1 FL=1